MIEDLFLLAVTIAALCAVFVGAGLVTELESWIHRRKSRRVRGGFK